MARSRNRKRKPYYSSSPGTFRPKERKEEAAAAPSAANSDPHHHQDEDNRSASPLSKARELKEEGNRKFQCKDYTGAMEQYDRALKLTLQDHPDRAIYHSNKAACLMQLKPVQFDAVISECSSALQVQPRFGRALLRRARAYETMGKLELALQDVQFLLQGDNLHQDAIDLAKRLRLLLGEAAQRDLQDGPPNPVRPSIDRSAADVPVIAKEELIDQSQSKDVLDTPAPSSDPMKNTDVLAGAAPVSDETTSPLHSSVQTGANGSYMQSLNTSNTLQKHYDLAPKTEEALQKRPLKLIYDHDIRLAEVSINCKFSDLRRLVKEKFPSSKAVLIKYKDMEGDLVTITNTKELRLAEVAAAIQAAKNRVQTAASMVSQQSSCTYDHKSEPVFELPVYPGALDFLRLYIVEVPAEQEPMLEEHEAGNKDKVDDNKVGEEEQSTDTGCSAVEDAHLRSKDIELDKWLLDFAQLFRNHLGIDSDAYVDLHELGLDLCSEALEEAATTEEAHQLFEKASDKFRTAAAQALYNWGNVHMCAARKQLPNDNEEVDFYNRLKASFNWAQEQYALAEEKFEQALLLKPDFYEGYVAFAQKDFEQAKLRWSLAMAQQVDLATWEYSDTIGLFYNAGKRMDRAAELLEKLKECRANKELPSPYDDPNGSTEVNGTDVANDLSDAQNQIYLFWGNLLYEHSQIEFRLGLSLWKQLFDDALQRYKAAGVSESEIAIAVEKHLSTSAYFLHGSPVEVDMTVDKHAIAEGFSRLQENNYVLGSGCPTTSLEGEAVLDEKEMIDVLKGESLMERGVSEACVVANIHNAIVNDKFVGKDISSPNKEVAEAEVQEIPGILNVMGTCFSVKSTTKDKDEAHSTESNSDKDMTGIHENSGSSNTLRICSTCETGESRSKQTDFTDDVLACDEACENNLVEAVGRVANVSDENVIHFRKVEIVEGILDNRQTSVDELLREEGVNEVVGAFDGRFGVANGGQESSVDNEMEHARTSRFNHLMGHDSDDCGKYKQMMDTGSQ